MVAFGRPTLNGGFSLIELMIVIVIMGILLSMAALPFQELLANQRLRSVTSDLVADLALARAEAIKRSSRVGIARTTADWTGGWLVFEDLNRDGTFDPETDGDGLCEAGEECVIISRPALNDTVKVCGVGAAFDVLTFGADGVVRAYNAGALSAVVPSMAVSSTLISPGVPARGLEFSPGGRVTVVTSGVAACP